MINASAPISAIASEIKVSSNQSSQPRVSTLY
jgi:hypothetical protein